MTTDTPNFMLGPYRITKAWKRQNRLRGNGEYCSLRRDVAAEIRRDTGEQIRLSPAGDGRSAAFTIHELHDDDAEIRIAKAGRERLAVSPGAVVTADPVVTKPGLTRMEAFELNDVTETVWDTGQDTLLVCAPHDGIESNTAQAAGIVRKRLGPKRASAWFIHAFGYNAYDQWHITSSNMSPASYPGLAMVSDRGFDYCVAFHAWDGADVLVGGLADANLRECLGERVAEVLNGKCDVVTDHSEGKYMAETEANVANRLTDDRTSGIQLELPPVIARQYRKRVARAVADFFDELLSTNDTQRIQNP